MTDTAFSDRRQSILGGEDAPRGLATLYYAMPSAPDAANAAGLAEHISTLRAAHEECAKLEAAGWTPRWCDSAGDRAHFEFAYEKRFAEEVDALIDIERLGLGHEFTWQEEATT